MNNLRRITLTTRNMLRYYSRDLYEPPYLEAMKPKIPLIDAINIQVRGYDYAILENYQKLIHNLAKNMELNVEEAWAAPGQDLQITTYKTNSEVVNSQYKLKVYQRTVQVTDVPTTQIPILLRVVEASAPAGVTIDVVHHEEHHDEERYIPDQELLDLKHELDEMGGARKK